MVTMTSIHSRSHNTFVHIVIHDTECWVEFLIYVKKLSCFPEESYY